MIALPELETIRRDVHKEVSTSSGRKIKAVEVLQDRVVKRSGSVKTLTQRLVNAKVNAVERQGLYLLLPLDPKDPKSSDLLVIRLGDSGQLRLHKPKDEVQENTVAVITFTQGRQVRLLDKDKEAELFLASQETLLEVVPELANLGMDPAEHTMSWTVLGDSLREREQRLKAALTDDSVVVGLGDVYSDEVLFAAGLRYDRTTSSLSSQEIRRLCQALVLTVHEAIKYRGSTLSDGMYLDAEGKPGHFQEHHNVYDRHKLPSPRSPELIVRKKYRGRWTYFCEQTQI